MLILITTLSYKQWSGIIKIARLWPRKVFSANVEIDRIIGHV